MVFEWKLDSSTIKEASKEVTSIKEDLGEKHIAKPYLKLTSKQKATIGQHSTDNGIVNVIRHFKGEFLKLKYDLRMEESLIYYSSIKLHVIVLTTEGNNNV